jgi:hypothetical protein
VIGEPIADFVYTIREIAPPAEQAALLFPYGSSCIRRTNAQTPQWAQEASFGTNNPRSGCPR